MTEPQATTPPGDPVATWTGTFRVFGVEVVCHVLSDGRRIVERDSIGRLLTDALTEGPEDYHAFIAWLGGA